MADIALPMADEFELPAPPPGFDAWAEATSAEWLATAKTDVPTVYVEFSLGAGRPFVMHHFIAHKES